MPDFPNAWCNTCKKFQEFWQTELRGEDTPGQFKRRDITCTVCRSILLTVYEQEVKLAPVTAKAFTHAFCDQCKKIQQVRRGGHGEDTSGESGDIACAVCGWILLTVYSRSEHRSTLR